MNIFTLCGTILIDNAKANESLSKTGKESEGLAGKFGKSFGKIKKLAVGLGIGIAVKKGFDIASKAVTDFTDKGDDIDKMSQKFSMSAESFQRWDSIAGHNGTNMETIGRSIKEITVKAEDNQEAYENMGISMQDANGNMRDSQDIFKDTILSLSDMEAGTARDAKAKELLGTKYQELLPLINGGRDAILGQLDASKDAVTMTDEQVEKAAAFKDTQQAVQEKIESVKMTLTEKLVPALITLMDWVTEHMPQIQEVFETVSDVIGGLLGGLGEAIKALVESAQTEGTFFNAVWKGIQIVFETVFNALQDIFAIFTAVFSGDWEAAWEGIKKLFSDVWEGIKKLLKIKLDAMIGIFKNMGATFKEAATALFNKVKEGFENVWEGIKEWVITSFDGIVTTILGFGTQMFDAGKGIFTQLWDGMKAIWDGIVGWVEKSIDWLGKKVKFWEKESKKVKRSHDNDGGADGSHANGLESVPFDGYTAILHKNERVLTAEENEQYNKGQNGNTTINQYFYDVKERETALKTHRATKKVLRELVLT